MIPYRIRRAVWADVPTLNQIVVAAAQQLNAANYSQAQIDSVLKYGYGVDTQLIEDGTYFVAEANGRLLGSGGWSRPGSWRPPACGCSPSPAPPTTSARSRNSSTRCCWG